LLNKRLLNTLTTTNTLELVLIRISDRDSVLEILRLNPHIKDRVNWSSQPERLSDWTRIKVDPNNIESITFLDLHNFGLTSFPDSINNLTGLRVLYADNNQLTRLPDISNLTSLIRLAVTNNQLTEIPDLSNLQNLEVLYADNNPLTKLPYYPNLTNLEELDISNTELPDLMDYF
jgi:Leucine-rich repeat (LRR) protein